MSSERIETENKLMRVSIIRLTYRYFSTVIITYNLILHFEVQFVRSHTHTPDNRSLEHLSYSLFEILIMLLKNFLVLANMIGVILYYDDELSTLTCIQAKKE